MSRKMRNWNPGDAANAFIRCLLADAGEILGGITHQQWAETLEYFEYKCAYSGVSLTRETAIKDHAIPINKTDCGLHLFGNVIPCTSQENKAKGCQHFREYLRGSERLTKTEAFLKQAQYWEKAQVLGDLRAYCQTQYEVITALCQKNRNYILRTCGEIGEHRLRSDSESDDSILEETLGAKRVEEHVVLQILLVPSDQGEFKAALLRNKLAWITTEFADGRRELAPWIVRRFNGQSSVFANLRSRPAFRQGEWQRRGIKRITVSIEKPAHPET